MDSGAGDIVQLQLANMLKLVLFVTLLGAILAEEADVESFVPGREICEGDACETSCSGSDCSYCRSGSCCETRECNGCVNNCRSGCGSNNCVNDCFNACSYRQRRCNRRSCGRLAVRYVEPSPSHRSPINVETTLNITNAIHNVNHINIPISVNSSNVNYMNISSPSDVDIRNEHKCCTVMSPQQCNYVNETLTCKQEPMRICSPQCNQPTVIHRPVPYPVRVPQPYPVRVPISVPVPIRIPISVPVPAPSPCPSFGCGSPCGPQGCAIPGGCQSGCPTSFPSGWPQL